MKVCIQSGRQSGKTGASIPIGVKGQVSCVTRPIRLSVLWTAFAGLMALLVLVGTLWPLPELAEDENLPAALHWRLYPPDILRNILLFAIPATLTRSWRIRTVLLFAAGVSAGIELIQTTIPGRVPSVLDWIANLFGAWLGHRVSLFSHPGRLPTPTFGRRLYVGWSMLATFVIVLTPLCFRTRLPEPPWYAHTPPHVGHLEDYSGRILVSRINHTPLQHGLIPRGELPVQLQSEHRVTIQAIHGDPPEALSGLFLITDEDGREVAFLAVQGDDLMYRRRSWAQALNLETPRLWWRGALSRVQKGDPLMIQVRQSSSDLCLVVNQQERCGLAPRIEDGWQHWIPAQALSPLASAALNPLWLAGLALPLGYGYRRRVAETLLVALPVTAALAAPWLGPVAPTTATAFCALAVGLLAGRILALWLGHSKISS